MFRKTYLGLWFFAWVIVLGLRAVWVTGHVPWSYWASDTGIATLIGVAGFFVIRSSLTNPEALAPLGSRRLESSSVRPLARALWFAGGLALFALALLIAGGIIRSVIAGCATPGC